MVALSSMPDEFRSPRGKLRNPASMPLWVFHFYTEAALIRVGDLVVLDDGVTTGTVTWSDAEMSNPSGSIRVYSPRWYGNHFEYPLRDSRGNIFGCKGIEYNCHESDVTLLAEAA